MQPLRLLLVDDHALFREGLISLLSYQDDFTVVGEAEDAESALDRARALEPDIVLMDIELPGEDGVTATRRLTMEMPALIASKRVWLSSCTVSITTVTAGISVVSRWAALTPSSPGSSISISTISGSSARAWARALSASSASPTTVKSSW